MVMTAQALAVLLLLATAGRAQQWQWTLDRVMSGDFQGRCAYDEARERVVLFGTVERAGSLFVPRSFTFEWDGSRWLQRASESGQRRDCVLCYDASRGRVVRFCGSQGAPIGGTQAGDGQAWTAVSPLPGPRTLHAAAGHAATGRVLMFGGTGPTTWFNPLAETWELSGNAWLQRSPATAPSARVDQGMAYDSARQRSVLFGGSDSALLHNDTWEWNGTTWIPMQPTNAPSPRAAPGFAYDARRGRIVMFGGSGVAGMLDDTWEYDGSGWQLMTPLQRPSPRRHASMVFDRRAGHVLLFGGRDDLAIFTSKVDTWAYDGIHWQLLLEPPAPPRPTAAVVTHDPMRQRTMVFGGPYSDNRTWEGDGRAWRSFLPNPSPSVRYGQHGTFDLLRGRTVMFGGIANSTQLDDTWEWDGAVWVSIAASPRPAPRSGGCMAFDMVRGVAVLFGGQNFQMAFDDTWEWNGVGWQPRVTATRPSAGTAHAMCYDAALGRIVMYGGSSQSGLAGNTWHYDGVDWTLMATAGPNTPPRSVHHALAFHPQRGKTVMFGGTDQMGTYWNDLWEWNGSQWQLWTVPVRPEPQYGATLVYDDTNQRMMLFGGWFGQNSADAWVLGPYGPATAAAYGGGCAIGAPPTLRSDLPYLGNSGCAVELGSAAAMTPALLVGSLAATNVALPGGCTLLLQNPLVTALGVTNGHGFVRFPVPVRLDPNLRGAALFFQAAVYDGSGPLAGVTLTAGIRLAAGE